MKMKMNRNMNRKTTKINWTIIGIFLMLLVAVDFLVLRRAGKTMISPSANIQELPVYTKEDLKRYDGENLDAPVYLALDGYVYDVSPGREDFYNPGKIYHYLVGRDSSVELSVAGASIIQKKYLIVGKYQEE